MFPTTICTIVNLHNTKFLTGTSFISESSGELRVEGITFEHDKCVVTNRLRRQHAYYCEITDLTTGENTITWYTADTQYNIYFVSNSDCKLAYSILKHHTTIGGTPC